jgi:hypothetical protein
LIDIVPPRGRTAGQPKSFAIPFSDASFGHGDESAPGREMTALPMKQRSHVSPQRQSGAADLLSIGFSTAFANDARGVSVLQHPHNIWTARHSARG